MEVYLSESMDRFQKVLSSYMFFVCHAKFSQPPGGIGFITLTSSIQPDAN